MTEPLRLEISMDYPGNCISKNHMWRRGSRRNGLVPEAQRWKNDLAESVRRSLLYWKYTPTERDRIHVEVGARFFDRANSVDLQNILELVCDGVQEGTGVDDKHFTVGTRRPMFQHKIPEVIVYVTIEKEGNGGK